MKRIILVISTLLTFAATVYAAGTQADSEMASQEKIRKIVRESLPAGTKISDEELDKIIKESVQDALKKTLFKAAVAYLQSQATYRENVDIYKKWINKKVTINNGVVSQLFENAHRSHQNIGVDAETELQQYILDGLVEQTVTFMRDKVVKENPGENPLEILYLIADREAQKDHIKTNDILGYLIVAKIAINSVAEQMTKNNIPYSVIK